MMRLLVKRQDTLMMQTEQSEVSAVAPTLLTGPKREVLVAITGTKPSKKLVEYASEVASSLSAKVILMYLMSDVDVPEEFLKFARLEGISNPKEQYLRSVAEQATSDLAEELKEKGLEYELVYTRGSPVRRIREMAEWKNLSFVVVELRGLHGIGRLGALVNSARRIIENSPVPVIAIPTA